MPAQEEPLDDLGWRGEYQWDSPEVVALRERLQQHAGIQGLEIVDPDTDPDYAARAAEQFHRDGFVIVANVLDDARLATIRQGCADTIREMVALDPEMAGNRGSHRYTFGTAPAHFGHHAAWATLIDPPRAMAVIAAIFGSEDFHQTSSASGGDFVLPGTTLTRLLTLAAASVPMHRHPCLLLHSDFIICLQPETTRVNLA
jgi:hypothetical protein